MRRGADRAAVGPAQLEEEEVAGGWRGRHPMRVRPVLAYRALGCGEVVSGVWMEVAATG